MTAHTLRLYYREIVVRIESVKLWPFWTYNHRKDVKMCLWYFHDNMVKPEREQVPQPVVLSSIFVVFRKSLTFSCIHLPLRIWDTAPMHDISPDLKWQIGTPCEDQHAVVIKTELNSLCSPSQNLFAFIGFIVTLFNIWNNEENRVLL